MSNATRYIVTAPLAIIPIEGKLQYLYQDAPVPEGADAEDVERLARRGLIGEVDSNGELVKRDDDKSAAASRSGKTAELPPNDSGAGAGDGTRGASATRRSGK